MRHNKTLADWVTASMLLREALEGYQERRNYPSLTRVIDELIDYIETQSGKWLSEKTIKRDIGNRRESKRIHRIPDWRVKLYAHWLREYAQQDREWIARWLEHTAYTSPGKLLAEVDYGIQHEQHLYQSVNTNVPPLKNRLWGRFLGRQRELERLRDWADQQRHPIAVLYGFGGNGKTTIQQKVGEEFVYGVKCPLRWPFEGAVWVSAVDYQRGQPGLLDILRRIVKTFELDTGWAQKDLCLIRPEVIEEKVKSLLETRRVLVLLDNFETISLQNQLDILRFFNALHGTSQLLISSRYRPDWTLEHEQHDIYPMAHVLIQVDGLSADNAIVLVRDFLTTKGLPLEQFAAQELQRLVEITHNNPKIILTLLGLLEQGIPLATLLNAIVSGRSEADRVYDIVIDRAWKAILSETDKAVLMAKALFSHSVGDEELGRVAGVSTEALHTATKKLAGISFFEFEHSQYPALRIHTHPLAQDFALRILKDFLQFEREAEARWWNEYALNIVRKARKTAYGVLTPAIEEDVANVLEHLEDHVQQRSDYCLQATTLFTGIDEHAWLGLGHTLRWWGRFDDTLRVAEQVLQFGIEQRHPGLIAECALRLISVIHLTRHAFDAADYYIGLALDQNARLNDRWLGAVIEQIRAFLYFQRGYPAAAVKLYQEVLPQLLELGNAYDLAVAYAEFGRFSLFLAIKDLESVIDTQGMTAESLQQVEEYLDKAESYLHQEGTEQWVGIQFIISHLQAHRAVIARVRGELARARDLLQAGISHAQSSVLLATLHRELALVEHVAGNRELAHSYEELGLTLFQQLGMLSSLSPEQSYTVIDRMKQAGAW